MRILDDSELYISVFSLTCHTCKHFTGGPGKRNCKAFKDIPLPIWESEEGHRKPYNGDGGIMYKSIK